ncbi:hypothetical protein EMIT047CA2_80149 [Pseudomonas soli]
MLARIAHFLIRGAESARQDRPRYRPGDLYSIPRLAMSTTPATPKVGFVSLGCPYDSQSILKR